MYKLVFVFLSLTAGNPPGAHPVAQFEVETPFKTEAACAEAAKSDEGKAFAMEVGKNIQQQYAGKIKIDAVGAACKKVADADQDDDKVTDPSGDKL